MKNRLWAVFLFLKGGEGVFLFCGKTRPLCCGEFGHQGYGVAHRCYTARTFNVKNGHPDEP